MSSMNGNFLALYLNGKIAGYDTNASLSIAKETRSANHKGSGKWDTKEASNRSWSASGEGFVAANGENFDALFNFIDSDELIPTMLCEQIEEEDAEGNITMKPKPNGKMWKGEAILKQLDLTAGLNDNATYSISLDGSGKLAKGTVPES